MGPRTLCDPQRAGGGRSEDAIGGMDGARRHLRPEAESRPRLGDGWSPYLLSLTYARLAGKPGAVLARMMMDEAEHVCATLVTRVVSRLANAIHAISLQIATSVPGPHSDTH